MKYWENFRLQGREHPISGTWKDVFTHPVEVTRGRSCYDSRRGYKINTKQKLADFFDKAFPCPVEATLVKEGGENGVSRDYYANAIEIGSAKECDMVISFMRTLRIPEDGRMYNLPPGFDAFPLFPIERFSSMLPTDFVAQGGIFLPMYRELHPFEDDIFDQ